MKRLTGALLLLLATMSAAAQTYSFGVLPQRSAVLTAEYWNPILDYVGRKAGVRLELGTRRSAQEYSNAEAVGEFDFVYNNHIFAPSHAGAGYRVIARLAGKPIHGEIVVPADSPLRSLKDLEGKPLGVPSKAAFVAYAVPMSALLQAGVTVAPVMGGNQEGTMAQLRSGTVPAAGVNSRVMQEYAARESFRYRALWTSEAFLTLPVAVHPRVPDTVAKAVRKALVGMAADREGMAILKRSAAVIKQEAPFGFVAADDSEYRNQRLVYLSIWKAEAR